MSNENKYMDTEGLRRLWSKINAKMKTKVDKVEGAGLFSGDYEDLANKPDLFDGDYDNLKNVPIIPIYSDVHLYSTNNTTIQDILDEIYAFGFDTSYATWEVTLLLKNNHYTSDSNWQNQIVYFKKVQRNLIEGSSNSNYYYELIQISPKYASASYPVGLYVIDRFYSTNDAGIKLVNPTINKSFTIDFESKDALAGGQNLSFVTTGEKYIWNNKSDFSGSYNDLSEKPNLFSGDYNDLSNKPAIPTKSSWNYDDQYVKYSAIQNLSDEQKAQARANIGAGASSFSGSYNDLIDTPPLGTASSKDTGINAGNIPVLDANGKIDTSVLPALTITDTFVVNSQSAMLALTAEIGDVCVRTDLNKSFILKTAGASTLDHWQELLTPTDAVSSVNGKTGAVTLTYSDVGAAAANHGHAYIPINGNSTINGGATGSPLTIRGYDSLTASTSIAFKDNVGNSRGQLGVNSSHQPVYIYGTEHRLAYYSDIPTSLPASDVYSWAKASSKPTYSWSEITGKPSSFTPASHNHYYLVTEADNRDVATTPNQYNNTFIFSGLKTNSYIGSPSSDTYSYVLGLRGWSDNSGGNSWELAFNNTGIFARKGETTSWNSWSQLITSSNIGSQSVNYASSAGSVAWGNVSGRPSSLPANGGTATVANYPTGFDSRATSDWSGVAGTFVTDWSVNGADIMFKADGSKLNVITDGYFYQGIDIYGSSKRVLDENDASSFAPASGSDNYVQKLAWWTSGSGQNVDDINSGTTFAYTNHNAPTNGTIVAFSCTTNNYTLQLQGQYNGECLYFRNKNGDYGTWNAWREVIHSGNIGSYAITSHQSLAGYATESWVEGKGYLTSHQSLSGYATQTWVENKGYITGITSSMVTDALGYTPPTQDTTYESLPASNRGTAVSLVTTGEKYTWNNKHTYRHTIRISGSKGTGIMVIITNSSTSCTGSGNYYPLASLLINAGFNSINNYYPVHLTSTASSGTISSSVIGVWGLSGYRLTFLIRSSGESMSTSAGDDGSAGWSYTDKVETLC